MGRDECVSASGVLGVRVRGARGGGAHGFKRRLQLRSDGCRRRCRRGVKRFRLFERETTRRLLAADYIQKTRRGERERKGFWGSKESRHLPFFFSLARAHAALLTARRLLLAAAAFAFAPPPPPPACPPPAAARAAAPPRPRWPRSRGARTPRPRTASTQGRA